MNAAVLALLLALPAQRPLHLNLESVYGPVDRQLEEGAAQFLVLGAKARAVLHGRYYASVEDIRAVAPPVLRHRIMTNFNAEAEGIDADAIIRRLIDFVPVTDSEARDRGPQPEVFKSGHAR